MSNEGSSVKPLALPFRILAPRLTKTIFVSGLKYFSICFISLIIWCLINSEAAKLPLTCLLSNILTVPFYHFLFRNVSIALKIRNLIVSRTVAGLLPKYRRARRCGQVVDIQYIKWLRVPLFRHPQYPNILIVSQLKETPFDYSLSTNQSPAGKLGFRIKDRTL